MTDDPRDDGYLTGHLLVAMPQMLDERFVKTVIYMCAHTEDGAMGLVVNKILEDIDFPDLLDQLDLLPQLDHPPRRVHTGPQLHARVDVGVASHDDTGMQDAVAACVDSVHRQRLLIIHRYYHVR